jgi:hypothetical protein
MHLLKMKKYKPIKKINTLFGDCYFFFGMDQFIFQFLFSNKTLIFFEGFIVNSTFSSTFLSKLKILKFITVFAKVNIISHSANLFPMHTLGPKEKLGLYENKYDKNCSLFIVSSKNLFGLNSLTSSPHISLS